MTLGQKQRLFARYVGKLLIYIYEQGYEVSLGEALRTEAQARANAAAGAGISNSLHKDKLAIDLNLFKDGIYLTETEAHKPFGEWWEAQHELARWGGRFGDGNHYSFTHGGRK